MNTPKMSSDEVERLKNEIANLNQTKQKQTEQIEKLKKKIDKERKNHSQEVSSIQSLKDTLQTTLTQIQELYTRSVAENVHQKVVNDEQAAKIKKLKEKVKSLEEELSGFKKQPLSRTNSTPSVIPTTPLLDSKQAESQAARSPRPVPPPSVVRAASQYRTSVAELPVVEPKEDISPKSRRNTFSNVDETKTPVSSPEHNNNNAAASRTMSNTNIDPKNQTRKSLSVLEVSGEEPMTGSASNRGTGTFSASGSLKGALPIPGKKISLSVTSQEIKVTTTAYSNWTISECVSRLQKRFPDKENVPYGLYVKSGKKIIRRLEEDKTLGFYTKLLDDPKNELALLPTGTTPDPQNIKRSKKHVTMDTFFELIKQQDVKSLRELLDTDTKYEMETIDKEWGSLPLHAAIRSSNSEIVNAFVKYYTKHNLNINIADKDGWTAMHYAVCNSSGNDSDEEILRALLELPTILVDVENTDRNTPLHYFSSKFIVPSCQELGEKLIEMAPSTINRCNKNGETPLHKAIFNPAVRVLMVKLLIKHGADVNIATAVRGDTALHYAVQLGRLDLLKILIQAGADLTLKNHSEKKTPYELAIANKQDKIASTIKNAQELYKWLLELKMEEYFLAFMKEELYLDIIAWINDSMIDNILDNMNISASGTRLRFRKAVIELKETYSKKAFEQRLAKAMTSATTSAHADSGPQASIGQLKKDLSDLLAKQDESLWELNHSEIEFTKELGNGKSGTVFKGLFRGNKVAIKVLKAQSKQATLEEFKKEFHIMSVLRSTFIVHFFGACLEPRICIVMEYCSRGSLYHVLKRDDKLNMDQAFKFAIETAAALKDLHTFNPPVYHRDMKSLNLLVTKDFHIKICDFGLARFKTAQNMETMSKIRGTYAYLAPELFSGSTTYTEKCDIFSCGIILWEIFSTVIRERYEAPYSEFPQFKMDVQVFFQVAKNSLRPTIPKDTPVSIVEVIKKCWAELPDERPTAQELYEHLVALETEYGKQVQQQPQTAENGTDEMSLMLKNKGSALLKTSGAASNNNNANNNNNNNSKN